MFFNQTSSDIKTEKSFDNFMNNFPEDETSFFCLFSAGHDVTKLQLQTADGSYCRCYRQQMGAPFNGSGSPYPTSCRRSLTSHT